MLNNSWLRSIFFLGCLLGRLGGSNNFCLLSIWLSSLLTICLSLLFYCRSRNLWFNLSSRLSRFFLRGNNSLWLFRCRDTLLWLSRCCRFVKIDLSKNLWTFNLFNSSLYENAFRLIFQLLLAVLLLGNVLYLYGNLLGLLLYNLLLAELLLYKSISISSYFCVGIGLYGNSLLAKKLNKGTHSNVELLQYFVNSDLFVCCHILLLPLY